MWVHLFSGETNSKSRNDCFKFTIDVLLLILFARSCRTRSSPLMLHKAGAFREWPLTLPDAFFSSDQGLALGTEVATDRIFLPVEPFLWCSTQKRWIKNPVMRYYQFTGRVHQRNQPTATWILHHASQWASGVLPHIYHLLQFKPP